MKSATITVRMTKEALFDFFLWKAAKAVREEEVYRDPMEMTFADETGITVRQDEQERTYPWQEVLRACVTPKTIAVYVGPEKALVIPKQDFGAQFATCYQIIARNMGMAKSFPMKKQEESGSE